MISTDNVDDYTHKHMLNKCCQSAMCWNTVYECGCLTLLVVDSGPHVLLFNYFYHAVTALCWLTVVTKTEGGFRVVCRLHAAVSAVMLCACWRPDWCMWKLVPPAGLCKALTRSHKNAHIRSPLWSIASRVVPCFFRNQEIDLTCIENKWTAHSHDLQHWCVVSLLRSGISGYNVGVCVEPLAMA